MWSCSEPSGTTGLYFSFPSLHCCLYNVMQLCEQKGCRPFFWSNLSCAWTSLQLCTKLLGGKNSCVGWRISGLDKTTSGSFLVTCSQPLPRDGCVCVCNWGFDKNTASGYVVQTLGRGWKFLSEGNRWDELNSDPRTNKPPFPFVVPLWNSVLLYARTDARAGCGTSSCFCLGGASRALVFFQLVVYIWPVWAAFPEFHSPAKPFDSSS